MDFQVSFYTLGGSIPSSLQTTATATYFTSSGMLPPLHTGLFLQEDASQEDASMILLFEAVNYKEKSISKLFCKSRETYCTFYSETGNLKSKLLKAALPKIGL